MSRQSVCHVCLLDLRSLSLGMPRTWKDGTEGLREEVPTKSAGDFNQRRPLLKGSEPWTFGMGPLGNGFTTD